MHFLSPKHFVWAFNGDDPTYRLDCAIDEESLRGARDHHVARTILLGSLQLLGMGADSDDLVAYAKFGGSRFVALYFGEGQCFLLLIWKQHDQYNTAATNNNCCVAICYSQLITENFPVLYLC